MGSIGLVQNSVPIIVKFPEGSLRKTGTDTFFSFSFLRQILNDINLNTVLTLVWS